MADQRILSTEKTVGAGHATLADTLNRLALVEHNNDGTHKYPGKLFAALHTQVVLTGTTNETTLASLTIPGGSMGPNGVLNIMPVCSFVETAGTKTVKAYFGGVSLGSYTFANTFVWGASWRRVMNRNSESSQITAPPTGLIIPFSASATGVYVLTSVNTAVDQTLLITGQLANAADTLKLEAVTVEGFRGA